MVCSLTNLLYFDILLLYYNFISDHQEISGDKLNVASFLILQFN